MKKKMSAHQRDVLYLDLACEDLKLKSENAEMMRKSCEQTD